MAQGTAGAHVFDEAEVSLVERALDTVAKRNPNDAKILRGLMNRVASLGEELYAMPSLRAAQTLGGQTRDEETLVAHLCATDGLAGDLELPVKAILSRSLLIAKIHFLRAFVIAVRALESEDPELHTLNLDLREEMGQSIYTQLAEELLLALLRKPDVRRAAKERAARQLIAIWDDAELEIDDFCPFLESAWRARNRIEAGLGSLLGASEYFRLVAEDCAPQFLDFFARDEVSEGEQQAFEEFLFNMTYEELKTLRSNMRSEGLDAVSDEWASQVLSRRLESPCNSDEIEPMAIYRSFYRRQLAADFRILADTEGPRRTAEAHLMLYLLDSQAL
ncbi:MAG: hypothetical protein KJO07_05390 [Deltaproteobacteria bacterium]|jgi:hypothetical protein|nr:hypothetical protein [Deltaproteobacteria bacterium]